jgi:uncharacterized protein YjiS (DUF1127 family)
MSVEASGGIMAAVDGRFSVADWSRGIGKKITGTVAEGLRRALAHPRRLRAGRDLAGLSDALLRDIGVSHGEIAFMAHRFAVSSKRIANADH